MAGNRHKNKNPLDDPFHGDYHVSYDNDTAMANLLSRKGALDRGTYQITQDLFIIVGFFAIFVIFFNTTGSAPAYW